MTLDFPLVVLRDVELDVELGAAHCELLQAARGVSTFVCVVAPTERVGAHFSAIRRQPSVLAHQTLRSCTSPVRHLKKYTLFLCAHTPWWRPRAQSPALTHPTGAQPQATQPIRVCRASAALLAASFGGQPVRSSVWNEPELCV